MWRARRRRARSLGVDAMTDMLLDDGSDNNSGLADERKFHLGSAVGFRRERQDAFMDLSLDMVEGGTTVEDALWAYTAPETLDGDNCWHCDKCDETVEASKGLRLQRLQRRQPLLMLQLKRFRVDLALQRRVTSGVTIIGEDDGGIGGQEGGVSIVDCTVRGSEGVTMQSVAFSDASVVSSALCTPRARTAACTPPRSWHRGRARTCSARPARG